VRHRCQRERQENVGARMVPSGWTLTSLFWVSLFVGLCVWGCVTGAVSWGCTCAAVFMPRGNVMVSQTDAGIRTAVTAGRTESTSSRTWGPKVSIIDFNLSPCSPHWWASQTDCQSRVASRRVASRESRVASHESRTHEPRVESLSCGRVGHTSWPSTPPLPVVFPAHCYWQASV